MIYNETHLSLFNREQEIIMKKHKMRNILIPKYGHIKKQRLKRALNWHYLQIKVLEENLKELFVSDSLPIEIEDIIKENKHTLTKLEDMTLTRDL